MTFMDFIEAAFALMRRSPEKRLDPDSTHVFHVGEQKDCVQFVRDNNDDIAEECAGGVIPLPYNDTSFVTVLDDGGFVLDRIQIATDPSSGGSGYCITRVDINNGGDHYVSWWVFDITIRKDLPKQNGCVKLGYRIPPMALFNGAPVKVSGHKVVEEIIFEETAPALFQAAAVSHPANYVVRKSPTLTPKEQKKVASGKPVPDRKRPHFIVVDHEVLVDISKGKKGDGTHASPVPHHRRGHWRRLSERCHRAKKLLGRDKTFVRPTYVGETTFSDEKNVYDVLMDFSPQKKWAGSGSSV